MSEAFIATEEFPSDFSTVQQEAGRAVRCRCPAEGFSSAKTGVEICSHSRPWPRIPFPVAEHRRNSIATRTGDSGETSLLFGHRVPKTHPQIECAGNFDELNSVLGLARSACTDPWRSGQLIEAQKDLVKLMGEVAVPESEVARWQASKLPKLEESALARLDAAIERLEAANLTFDGWATPGANPHAAALDLARSVCRRAERSLAGVAASGRHPRELVFRYVNRLSDLLWLLARQAET